MIEAAMTLGESPFLDSVKRVDSAVVGMRGRILSLNQTFQGFDYIIGTLRGQFDRLRETLDLGGKMADLSAQTGTGAGEMLVLGQALKNAGGSLDSASGFAAKFQKALSGLNEDGDSTAKTLDQLGLSAASLRRLPLLEQVQALQKAVQGIAAAEDRVKIVSGLFGKGGAQQFMPFLIDTGALAGARTQLGGLAPIIERNAGTFDKLSDSLGALTIKAQQFYAGFAEAFSDKFGGIADSLDAFDLTGFGQSVGKLAGSLAQVAAVLPRLQPLLVAFGGVMIANRLAATNFGTALTMALRNPTEALAGAALKWNLSLTSFRGALTALPVVAGRAMTGLVGAVKAGMAGIYSALGPVGIALLIGEGIRGAISGKTARIDAASNEVSRATGEGSTEFQGFLGQKRAIHSEKERADLLKTMDAAANEWRKKAATAGEQFQGAELERVQAAFTANADSLQRLRASAEKSKLSPITPTAFEAVAGKTPLSGLARLGGTGIGAGAGDPLLAETRRQTRLLESLVAAASGARPQPVRNPVPIPI